MNDKIINMQFPYDCTNGNDIFDGQIHRIIPDKLLSIPNTDFYIMDYFDINMNSELFTTLLINLDKNWFKVPLNNYDDLFDYMDSHELNECNISQIDLPDHIGLAQNNSLEEILSNESINLYDHNSSNVVAGKKADTPAPPSGPPSFDSYNTLTSSQLEAFDYKFPSNGDKNYVKKSYNHNLYVPVSEDEQVSFGTDFELSSISNKDSILASMFDLDNTSYSQIFLYEKQPRFNLKDNSILDGYYNRKYVTDIMGTKRYSFSIDVPNNTFAKMDIPSKDGQINSIDVLILPGVHNYNVVYKDYLQESYEIAQKAKALLVGATDEYKDTLKADRVFEDAGKRLLPMSGVYVFGDYERTTIVTTNKIR